MITPKTQFVKGKKLLISCQKKNNSVSLSYLIRQSPPLSGVFLLFFCETVFICFFSEDFVYNFRYEKKSSLSYYSHNIII